MKRILTIGRELGRRLSEKLNLAYYDREIITEIAKRTSLELARLFYRYLYLG